MPEMKAESSKKKRKKKLIRIYIEGGSLFLSLVSHRVRSYGRKNFIQGKWLKGDKDPSSTRPGVNGTTLESNRAKSDLPLQMLVREELGASN